jgi:hypothetical protein|tara:strand:+ start:639 stop:863 length:225 start_codon:yes stop_codon:yes gene_type:complete
METVLFVFVALYCIYLNIRIKDIEKDIHSCSIDRAEMEISLANRIMEVQKRIKTKEIKVAKPRRRSTKKRSKVS